VNTTDLRLTFGLTVAAIVIVLLMWASELGEAGLWRVSSSVQVFVELVFYVIVLTMLGRKLGGAGIAIGAALTLAYRLAIGASAGLITALVKSYSIGPAVESGMAHYHPGVIAGAVLAPFAMMPLLLRMFGFGPKPRIISITSPPAREPRQIVTPTVQAPPVPTVPGATAERSGAAPTDTEAVLASALDRTQYTFRVPTADAAAKPGDDPFVEAVEQLAGHPGAKGAVVVDGDGLVVASAGAFDAEEFAPIVLEMLGGVNGWAYRMGSRPVGSLSATTDEGLFVVERVGPLVVAALVPPGSPDLVRIRMERARGLVEKRLAERYPTLKQTH
jgi:predicted regulator of Ras-like GTPase activity (Roadblock/LC7/MglB family)